MFMRVSSSQDVAEEDQGGHSEPIEFSRVLGKLR